jgi:hypothetical protein
MLRRDTAQLRRGDASTRCSHESALHGVDRTVSTTQTGDSGTLILLDCNTTADKTGSDWEEFDFNELLMRSSPFPG